MKTTLQPVRSAWAWIRVCVPCWHHTAAPNTKLRPVPPFRKHCVLLFWWNCAASPFPVVHTPLTLVVLDLHLWNSYLSKKITGLLYIPCWDTTKVKKKKKNLPPVLTGGPDSNHRLGASSSATKPAPTAGRAPDRSSSVPIISDWSFQ